jgi:hypothetical protein
MEAGHDDLDAGQTGARLDVDGDPPAVVTDLDRAVGVQVDLDAPAVTLRMPGATRTACPYAGSKSEENAIGRTARR